MPRVDLAGKPILITGASSGIGAATARACAAAGMPVALVARREDKLRAVADDVERAGVRTAVCVGDVTDAGACRAAVGAAVTQLGPMYAVFANAGYGLERSFVDTTDGELRAIFEANFWGTVNILRPMIDAIRVANSDQPGRGGHVVVCSSSIGKAAVPYYGAYCATKAAQWPLAQAIDAELRSEGIYASTVHPIGTETEFFERSKKRSGGKALSDNTPAFFMQPPERVARAVVGTLRRPRLEVWTSTPTRLALGLMTAFPGVASFVQRRMAAKRSAATG